MSEFGRALKAYMQQQHIAVRELARRSGYSAGYVSELRRGLKHPSPEAARDIDDALAVGGKLAALVPAVAAIAAPSGLVHALHGSARDLKDWDATSEARDVMSWVTGTNASDDVIGELAGAANYLAEAHARLPIARILLEVLGVHRAIQSLLRGGRQRLSQARELLRIDSALLAHACLLLGDLGQHETARIYGNAALLCAQESEADEGIAWTAMAKTARWQDRFAEAAELAGHGFQVSRQASVRAELAYREANAVALFGDVTRAQAALQRADRAADGLDDDGTSAWSFSRGRQAIFTLSVCIHTGDPDGALRAAIEADAYWDAGGGMVTATWAQVRAGAAMAHLLKDSLDGAAAQLTQVLELPPDQRIRTVTGYMDEVSEMLQARRFASSPLAAELREQIREFSVSGMTEEQGS
jgi:transcriptional regulator with XRE-family HTH domain